MKNFASLRGFSYSFLSLALFTGIAVAAGGAPIQITSQINELIEQANENGEMQLVAIAADKIIPGDRILYTTTFQNNGQQDSDNITITNPVPDHNRYLNGSAQCERCTISFSVDKGQYWGMPNELKVRSADGSLRPASADDYTHIRWSYQSPLRPAELKSVSFQTVLK